MTTTNLLPTIVPKSDQLNADDLIGRSLTIKITKVSLTEAADQPVAIHYEGENGKPYKPCKSMRRVMVLIWGDDGNEFIGRRMTLFRDERVTFGPDAVGGIRISHMSHIDRETTVALTAKRGSRKPYTVKPLAVAPEGGVNLDVILSKGEIAARKGSAALTTWWQALSKAEKVAAKPTLDDKLKAIASKSDLDALGDEPEEETVTVRDVVTGELVDDEVEAAGEAVDDAGSETPDEAETLTGEAAEGRGFDHMAWASEAHGRVEKFTTLASLNAFTDDADSKRNFELLREASPQLAKALLAAINGKRKALADKEASEAAG